MRNLIIAVATALLFLVGCNASSSQTPLTTDHPGHPNATEAPAPQPSQVLTADRSAAAQDQSMHDMHGAHQHGSMQSAAAATTQSVVYTCPMHPEVVADKPGKCPKCGMNLVKKGEGK
jgi:hypothetical protein